MASSYEMRLLPNAVHVEGFGHPVDTAPTGHHGRHSPVEASPKKAQAYPPVQSVSFSQVSPWVLLPVLGTQTVTPFVSDDGRHV